MTLTLLDKFVDRLMIPVTNKRDNTIGYTGRLLNDNNLNRPKYLNSSETFWFQKGKVWFGWSQAIKAIKNQKCAILVEGNMDVIVCHKYQIENVLASQGTSFTREQIELLKIVTNTVYLAFDNDKAGIISSDKLFVVAQELNLEVKKLLIPSEFKDLDEYLQYNQKEKKETKFEIVDYLDYLLAREIKNLTSVDSSTQRQAIISFLGNLNNSNLVTKEQFLKKLSDLTKLNKNTLEQFYKEITDNSRNSFDINKLAQSSTNTSNTLSTNKQSTELQRTLVTWEKLCAIYAQGKLNNEYQNKIYWLFLILKSFLTELEPYKTLEEYISEQLDILTLIFENIDSDKASQTRLWTYLTFGFIEQNWNRILLDSELKNYYNQIKKA